MESFYHEGHEGHEDFYRALNTANQHILFVRFVSSWCKPSCYLTGFIHAEFNFASASDTGTL